MAATVSINYELSDTRLSDVLITAFDASYGGCWYWARPVEFKIEKHRRGGPQENDSMDIWRSVEIYEEEDENDPDRVVYKVTHDTLALGISKILGCEVETRDDLMMQVLSLMTPDYDVDADAADCIVQAGLFTEIRYG